MAKRKPKVEPEQKPDKPEEVIPEVASLRSAMTMIRSRPEWKAWLDRLADHCRSNVSDTVDRAVVELARNVGFTEGPPKR